jgi:hypothetical protein
MPSSRVFQVTSRPSRVRTAATLAPYYGGMFDVGGSLGEALAAGRGRLLEAQAAIARANAGENGGRAAAAAMAQAAEAAVFTEALLSAERARFEAIKTASR